MTTKVKLANVRLFFPRVFTAEQYQGAGAYNYSAKFGVEPGSANHKAILAAIEEEGSKVFEKKWPALKAMFTNDKKSYPYFDGATVDFEGADGLFILTAKRKKEAGPVVVLDRNKQDVTEEQGLIYSGCYVHASIEIWAQNSAKGKGIRCTLRGVQFSKDGDSFAGGGRASKDEFDDLSADDEVGFDVDDLSN